MPTPPPDDAFLCERCGYVLDGLAVDGACPECGTSVRESAGDARIGSRYQLRPDAPTSAASMVDVLLHPTRQFRRCRISSRSTRRLTENACVGAGLVIAAAAFISTASGIFQGRQSSVQEVLIESLGVVFVFGVGSTLLMLTLVAIERAGIRFFGRRRGWRISKDVARVVTSHAGAGWIIGAILFAIGLPVGDRLSVWMVRNTGGYLIWDLSYMMPWLVPLAGFFAGMIVFELLVWKGVQACRFANPPGVGPGTEVAEPGESTNSGRTETTSDT